jgi:hypothetical protein
LLSFLRDRIPLPSAATPGGAPGVEPAQTQTDDAAETRTDEAAETRTDEAAKTRTDEAAEPQKDEAAETQTRDQGTASVEPAPAGQPSAPVPGRLPSWSLGLEELAPIRDGKHSHLLSPNEPASVRLTMRIDPVGAPSHDALDFSASIVARRFAGHDRSPLGTTHGTVRVSDPVSVEVTGPALPADLYRLVVTVDIYPAEHSPDKPPLHRMRATGDLMRVADVPLGSTPAVA